MNSHQRRKARRKVDRLFKLLFGCSEKEFLEGKSGIASYVGLYNGSAGGGKTWQNKTLQQILDDVNEALRKVNYGNAFNRIPVTHD
jgi:hypothetical protein